MSSCHFKRLSYCSSFLLAAWFAQATASAVETQIAEPAALAYVSIRTGDANIYTRSRQGTERMITHTGINTQPALSSTGRVAFSARVGPLTKIFTAGDTGLDVHRLTASTDAESAPSWSPDGRFLAYFSSNSVSGVQSLIVFDTTRKTSTTIAGPGKSMGPAPVSWSADGARMAWLAEDTKGKNQVFVANRDGTAVQELSSKLAPRGAGSANLSPDGNKVVWVADLRGRMPIMVSDVDSGATKDLTEGVSAGHESPRWSPDGKQIIFASPRDNPQALRNDVFVMDADGTNVRNLTRSPHEDFDPKWSADGSRVVYVSLRNGTSQLFEVGSDGANPLQLTHHASHDMDHVVRPALAAR